MPFTSFTRRDASSFSIFSDSMMQNESLPLTEVMGEKCFQEGFDDHGIDFGDDEEAVYTPAIVLWALVSQVFFKGEQRGCAAAVSRIASWWASQDRLVDDTNTGAHCRARAKIPFEVLRQITRRLAEQAESAVDIDDGLTEKQAEDRRSPSMVNEVRQQPVQAEVLLVDGFTVDVADTPENQAEFPQNPAQQEGLGFPILRCVSLISMGTGLLVDLAIASYCGKDTGETALLWQMMDQLREGDVLAADSYYCTYWLVGLCRQKSVEIVMKNHHKRKDHPADAKRICKGQRKVIWDRPQRPRWMTPQEYQQQPKRIEIRLVDVQVSEAGFRPESFTIATTIIDHRVYTSDWIGSVDRSRWLVELDIRSIKCSLGMEQLRAKSPPMVRTDRWSCLLADNLIRIKMLQSGEAAERDVRGMSFTETLQMLGANWLLCGVIGVSETMASLGQSQPADATAGHRPGRFEPRKNKRRPKVLALMTKPRDAYKNEIGVAA